MNKFRPLTRLRKTYAGAQEADHDPMPISGELRLLDDAPSFRTFALATAFIILNNSPFYAKGAGDQAGNLKGCEHLGHSLGMISTTRESVMCMLRDFWQTPCHSGHLAMPKETSHKTPYHAWQ